MNLGRRPAVSLLDLVEMLSGSRPRHLPVVPFTRSANGSTSATSADTTRVREVLGWRARVHLEDGPAYPRWRLPRAHRRVPVTRRVPFVDLAARYERCARRSAAPSRRVLESGWFILGPWSKRSSGSSPWPSACRSPSPSGTEPMPLRSPFIGPGCRPWRRGRHVPVNGRFHGPSRSSPGASPRLRRSRPVDVNLGSGGFRGAPSPPNEGRSRSSLWPSGGHGSDPRRSRRHGGDRRAEDACQAHGAALLRRPVGTLGRAAALSFYPARTSARRVTVVQSSRPTRARLADEAAAATGGRIVTTTRSRA